MFAALQVAYAELSEARMDLEARAAEIAEERELFEQVIDSISEALLLADRGGTVIRVNGAAAAMLERDEADLLGRHLRELVPAELPSTPWELTERAPAGVIELDVTLRSAGGRRIPASASCGTVRDKLGRTTGLAIVARDIRERKRAEDALAFLAEASRALAETLDYESTLAQVAQLAVPQLADGCSVHLRQDDGTVRRLATARAQGVRGGRGPDRRAVARVAATGVSQLRPTSMCVALSARGRSFGALVFTGASRASPYGADDLRLAEEVGRRAALAIDNARLYEVERRSAEMLQRSLLPDRLPELPGLALAARYLPAQPQAIGGDWYDVLELPGGGVAFVMGDVAGHGVGAAAVMGQLRNALRAYALDGHDPPAVVQRLERLMSRDAMATLLYMVFDPERWEISWVNAGHLPPVLVPPSGPPRLLHGGTLPLLGHASAPRRALTATIAPGTTLLLYTDGLVEVRREPIDERLEALRREAARVGGADPERLVEELVAAMLPRGNADDVGLLAIHVGGVDRQRLRRRVAAVPESLASVRQGLRRWLERAGASPAEVDDIGLACGEACANAIEHAYGPAGGVVDVEARLERSAIRLTVRDFGRWRPPRGGARGRGRAIMGATMDTVEFHRNEDGTTVRMTRALTGRGEP